ncbi:hypothetical protein BGZ94_007857 [Podila epigama]|nr:hypothetical protein BGZ94_007857 [Podila epigama]
MASTNAETPSTQTGQAVATSPLHVPEVFAQIALYFDQHTLVQMIQVCREFHQVCIPLLWHTVRFDFDYYEEESPWTTDKGFRLGFLRHGRWIEKLSLEGNLIQDGDLELVAENCPRLKELDLSRTNVTAETLQVLIHSDPYKTDPTFHKKRKRGDTEGDNADDEEGDDDEDLDLNERMAKYRRESLTETETEIEPDSQYESIGFDPSSSDQAGDDHDAAGPIVQKGSNAKTSSSSSASYATHRIPIHRLSGTTRPAKFKGTVTRFPFQLKAVLLDQCSRLNGNKALKILQRLGPQLEELSLDHVIDLDDTEIIAFMRHCPNLVSLSLRGCNVTDRFLSLLTTDSSLKDMLQTLSLDVSQVTGSGLTMVARECRKLKRIACTDTVGITSAVLLAFTQPSDTRAPPRTLITTTTTAAADISLRPSVFTVNTALTHISFNHTDKVDSAAFTTLFQYATELQSIQVPNSKIKDDALIMLAENYVRRLERLGLRAPASWVKHVQQLQAVPSLTSVTSSSSTSSSDSTTTATAAGTRNILPKHIPGGLQSLNLNGCHDITNRGMRAIGRACVGLRHLNISDCPHLSLELFLGPWAMNGLRVLQMQDMILVVDGKGRREEVLEEKLDRARFPLDLHAITRKDVTACSKRPVRWPVTQSYKDIEMQAQGFFSLDEMFGMEESDEHGLRRFTPGSAARWKLQRPSAVKAEHLAILRSFYKFLGRCWDLEVLDMCNVGFNVSLKHGLDQVLPALQHNLVQWRLVNHVLLPTLDDEFLAWLGCHFGYGEELNWKKGQKSKATTAKNKDTTAVKKRVSKLKYFSMSDLVLEGIESNEVYEWVMEQIPNFDIVYHN